MAAREITADKAKTIFQASALTSELVTPSQLTDAVVALQAAGEKVDDKLLAATLVRQGLLTEYQAEQLKQGRTKLSLGMYTITDFIARGGMGNVYKAVHKVMGRECAVKTLPIEKSNAESRNNFRREVRMQAGLDCDYLVRAFDAGEDGKTHFLVTEYVPGTDLRKFIKSSGPISLAQSASFIRQAALGLDYAHQQGMIHRDVKPGNILVTPDGRVKVSDVGLAAWGTAMNDDPRAGKIVGTADYLSPEQIQTPLNVGPATDIYSLGCTLYYCITGGKVPYPGGNTASKCRRHCEDMPLHPRNFASDLPDEFVDLIADMMEKDPADRITSAAEVAARLEPWCEDVDAIGQRPMKSGPWQAPPPPGTEGTEQAALYAQFGDDASQSGGQASDTGSQARSETIAPPVPDHQFPLDSRPNTLTAVAFALSIAIPFSLLVGAIIGYYVHEILSQPLDPMP